MSTKHTAGYEVKHSRGPWKVIEDADHPANLRITSDARPHVAKVYALSLDADPVADANARLIAAAPTLLAACKDILGFLKRSGYDTQLIKEVIALAEGDGA